MTKLKHESFKTAESFLLKSGRALEGALYRWSFLGHDPGIVVDALEEYRNSDGGFGHALEPDLRTPHSSILATTVAMQLLGKLGIGAEHPFVRGAVEYLLKGIDKEGRVREIIPEESRDAPHAPWWEYRDSSKNFHDFSLNPRAEILGYFFKYQDLLSADLIEGASRGIVDDLNSRSSAVDMHEMLCLLDLHKSTGIEPGLKRLVGERITADLPELVEVDEGKWGDYCLKPLWVVKGPDSPFYIKFKDAVEANMEYEIAHQNSDGSWSPFWSWGGSYPEAWKEAEREWRGVLTLNTLEALRAFGRIEGI